MNEISEAETLGAPQPSHAKAVLGARSEGRRTAPHGSPRHSETVMLEEIPQQGAVSFPLHFNALALVPASGPEMQISLSSRAQGATEILREVIPRRASRVAGIQNHGA